MWPCVNSASQNQVVMTTSYLARILAMLFFFAPHIPKVLPLQNLLALLIVPIFICRIGNLTLHLVVTSVDGSQADIRCI